MDNSPILQIRKSDQITEYLISYIAENKLTSGCPLPSETKLAKLFGVGRPTIREAIKSLTGSGLVQVSTGRPPKVGSIKNGAISQLIRHAMAINQISVHNTLEFRRFVEESSVMLAAVNRSATDVEELRNLIVDLREAKGDRIAFSKRDIAFHKVLARASGNPLVQIIIEGITDVALESSRTGLKVVSDDDEWSRILLIHENIAEAVIESSPDQAQKAMIAHFDNVWSRLNKK